MYANRFLPLDASAQEVKDFRKKVEDIGLRFSAICGDFGCAMYYTRDRELIDKEKRSRIPFHGLCARTRLVHRQYRVSDQGIH